MTLILHIGKGTRVACNSAQSDQGLRFPQTFDAIEYEQRRSWLDTYADIGFRRSCMTKEHFLNA